MTLLTRMLTVISDMLYTLLATYHRNVTGTDTMSVVKALVSFFRSKESNPIERYRSRIVFQEQDIGNFSDFKKQVISFLGIKDQASKYGLGQYDLKLFRLSKADSKIENYVINTSSQYDLEKTLLFNGEGELNGKQSLHNIQYLTCLIVNAYHEL